MEKCIVWAPQMEFPKVGIVRGKANLEVKLMVIALIQTSSLTILLLFFSVEILWMKRVNIKYCFYSPKVQYLCKNQGR